MNHDKDSSTVTTRQQNVVLNTPYGELRLENAMAAHDHATMKAQQLKAVLVLINGEGRENFSFLNGELQNSLLWMLQQSASELEQLLAQVKIADVEVSK